MRLGDISASFAQLAAHKVLISGGSASADGRIGTGKGIRAALGAAATLADCRALYPEVISGTVSHVDLAGMIIANRRLTFDHAARALGVAGLVADLLDAGHADVVARDGQVMAVWIAGQRWLPGLDGRGAPLIRVSPTPHLGHADITPASVLREWLERCALRGQRGVLEPTGDAACLRELGAPTAAQLVERLAADYGQRSLTALAAYLETLG